MYMYGVEIGQEVGVHARLVVIVVAEPGRVASIFVQHAGAAAEAAGIAERGVVAAPGGIERGDVVPYFFSRKDCPGGKCCESLAIALHVQAALEYRMGRCQLPLMGGRLKLKALVATTCAGWAYPSGPTALEENKLVGIPQAKWLRPRACC